MKTINNLLVNGCSFSRGPDSWPYFLNANHLVNLAQSGAGNTYILESTISELVTRSYDLVIIMWSGISRIDINVEQIDLFNKSKYTSHYQLTQNDWPTKIIYPINDQNYVDPNWIFGCGHINQEPAMISSKAFKSLYKYQGTEQLTRSLIIKMISLQNILKQLNVPYFFTFFQDYENELKQFQSLYKLLDQNYIVNHQNINTITKKNNWFDLDGVHPGILAHKQWADILLSKIENNYDK